MFHQTWLENEMSFSNRPFSGFFQIILLWAGKDLLCTHQLLEVVQNSLSLTVAVLRRQLRRGFHGGIRPLRVARRWLVPWNLWEKNLKFLDVMISWIYQLKLLSYLCIANWHTKRNHHLAVLQQHFTCFQTMYPNVFFRSGNIHETSCHQPIPLSNGVLPQQTVPPVKLKKK